MAYLVQTLASGLDLTGYAHLVLHNDGFLVSSPARHCIYYVENGVATVWAGADGESGTANGNRLTARFNSPCGLTKDNSGNIYISDKLNHVIRKIDVFGNVSVLAGSLGVNGTSGDSGQASSALLDSPVGLSFAEVNLGTGRFNALFLLCANERIRYINLDNGNIYLGQNGIAGTPTGYLSAILKPPHPSYVDATIVFIGNIGTPDAWWSPSGVLSYLKLYNYGIELQQAWGSSSGYYHVVNDSSIIDQNYVGLSHPLHYFTTPENKIYKYNGTANSEVVIAGTGVAGFNGDGEALQTQINNPTFILNDNTGIYFIDSGNSRVRRIIQSEIAYIDSPLYLLQANYVPTSIIKQSPVNLTLQSEHDFRGGVLENLELNYEIQISEFNPVASINQEPCQLSIQGFKTDLAVSFYVDPVTLNLSQQLIPINGVFDFVNPATYELGNDLISELIPNYDLIETKEINSTFDLINAKEIQATYDITEFNQIDNGYDLVFKNELDIIYSREKYKDFSVRYTHTGIVFSSKEIPLGFAPIFASKEIPLRHIVFSSKEIPLRSYDRLFVSKEITLGFKPIFSSKEIPLRSIAFSSKEIPLKTTNRTFASKEIPLNFAPIFTSKEIPLMNIVFTSKEIPLNSLNRVFVSKECQTKIYSREFFSKEMLTVIHNSELVFSSKEIPLTFEQSAGTTVIDSSNEHFWLEYNNSTIPISKYDISISASDVSWKGQVEINNEHDYFKLNTGDIVYLHIPSQVFKLIVMTKNISKKGLKERGFNALLESPISLLNNVKINASYGNDVASNIANQIYDTEWDLIDWIIPQNSLVVNEGSPLNLLKQLSECVGGVISSKPNGSLLARSKFKFSANKWDRLTPEFTIPQDFVFFESLTSQAVKRWDSVIVSSGESREISYAVETIEVDKQKYLICRPSIWREDIYLFHTSKYPTGIRYVGALEETIEEQIEIKEGKASISKPVSELIEYNYHWKDLGALEVVNNELVLVNMPDNKLDAYSLVKVKYKTKFHKWAVGGGDGDTAQFVFVAEKEF